MVSYATFIARYPEFAAVIPPTGTTVADIIGVHIADAEAYVSDSAFGALRDKAVCLVAAHRAALRHMTQLAGMNGQNAPGVATSVSAEVGGMSVVNTVSQMVSSPQSIRADFARTNYGLEYLSLVDVCVAGGKAVL